MALPLSTNYGPQPPNPMHQQQPPDASEFQPQHPHYEQNGAQNGLPPQYSVPPYQHQPAQNISHAGKSNANVTDTNNYGQHPHHAQDGALSQRQGFAGNQQHPQHNMHHQLPSKQTGNYGNGVADLQNSLAGMSVAGGNAPYQQNSVTDGSAAGNNDYYNQQSRLPSHTTRDVSHGTSTPNMQQFPPNNYAGPTANPQQQPHTHINHSSHLSGGTLSNSLPLQAHRTGLQPTVQQPDFAQQPQQPYGGANQYPGMPAPPGFQPQQQYPSSPMPAGMMPAANNMPAMSGASSGYAQQPSSGYNSYTQQQPLPPPPGSLQLPSSAMAPPGAMQPPPGSAGNYAGGPPLPGAPSGMHQPYQQPGMLPRGPLGGAPQLSNSGPAGGINRSTLPDLQRFIDRDREQFRQGAFVSGPQPNPNIIPPSVLTRFINYDQGLASPHFIRFTMNIIPESEKLLKETGLPFYIYLSPFAEQPDGEEPVPVIDYRPATIVRQAQASGMLAGGTNNTSSATNSANTEEDPLKIPGPVRCTRCKAYMCPFMMFIDGGQRFKCAFCPMTTDVPPYYASYMDNEGNRQDKMSRPELHRGVYEFIVGDLYGRDNKEPQSPPAFLFMIDVSYNAMINGMVAALCDYLRQELPALLDLRSNLDAEARGEHNKEPPSIRVGFATYSAPEVHFYNVSKELDKPHMMVVSDCDDMFVPLGGIDPSQGLLVDYRQCAGNIDKLLRMIPTMFTNSKTTLSMVAPVVKAGMEAIKASCPGGKIFMFHCSLPSYEQAPGVLRSREQRNVIGTEKEKELLRPMPGDSGKLYTKLATDCVEEAGCSVDLFLFPNQYIDVATLGELCRITGGSLYKYTFFSADRDRQRLFADVKRAVSRMSKHGCAAFDATVRIRTSLGLRPTDFYGSMHMKNTSEILLGSCDCDKSLAVEIKYDDKLDKGQNAYFQVAILYTHPCGQRRVRVINSALPVVQNTSVNTNQTAAGGSNEYTQIYNSGELPTLMNVWLKKHVTMLVQKNETAPAIRRTIMTDCINILAAYRRYSDTRSGPGLLLLPDRFTPMPLLCLGLSRSDVISGGGDVLSADDKSTFILDALQMPIANSIDYLYPRIIPLLPLLMELLGEASGETNSDNKENTANGTTVADDSKDDIITLSARLPRPVRCSMEEVFPAQLNPQQMQQLQMQQQQGGQQQMALPKKADGVFVLENGFGMFLWVGPDVDKRILRLGFGVSSLQELAASAGMQYSSAQSAVAAPVGPHGQPQGRVMPQQQQQPGVASAGAASADQGLPELDNPVNRRLRKLIRTIRAQKPQHWMRLTVVAGCAEPVLEQYFKRFLIEDRGANPQIQQAYAEYVVAVHYGVIELLNNSS